MPSRPSVAPGVRPEMGRPRSFTDEDAFLATNRVLAARGASELTLAAVAREIGCTGQALNARFGTRKGLLVAHADWSAIRDLERFSQVRAQGHSPVQTLRERFAIPAAEREEELAGDGGQLQRLSLLTEARHDAELKRFYQLRFEQFANEIVKLVRDAIAAGELTDNIDAEAIAELMIYATTGSSIYWFINERGTIESDVVRVIDQLLNPYLTSTSGDIHAVPAS